MGVEVRFVSPSCSQQVLATPCCSGRVTADSSARSSSPAQLTPTHKCKRELPLILHQPHMWVCCTTVDYTQFAPSVTNVTQQLCSQGEQQGAKGEKSAFKWVQNKLGSVFRGSASKPPKPAASSETQRAGAPSFPAQTVALRSSTLLCFSFYAAALPVMSSLYSHAAGSIAAVCVLRVMLLLPVVIFVLFTIDLLTIDWTSFCQHGCQCLSTWLSMRSIKTAENVYTIFPSDHSDSFWHTRLCLSCLLHSQGASWAHPASP